MKKSLIICLLGLIVLSSYTAQDRFKMVLNRIANKEIKKKLLLYKKNGPIEKKVPQGNVNTELMIKTANQYLGTKHVMGGLTKSGIDCSGLIKVAARKSDIILPHGSQPQSRFGKIVPLKKGLKRGDLIYFHSSYTTSKLVTHVGIVLGNGMMIHTSASKGVEKTSYKSKYWGSKFLFGKRLKANY